ncbi:MAG: hypothetical protein WCZ47_02590 [Bacilli bacterium]|jgi:multisubunit Na+/H+ antiporter MnhC subunit|nr:hypothetical protein [Bacilli bacterium]NLN80153.1 hypothetical protein [Erysipelotrichia bacterium]
MNNENNLFKKIFDLSLTIINVVISILMFLPIYNDTAVLPGVDSSGNHTTIRVKYPKTPYTRLVDLRIEWLLYLSFALFAGALVALVIYYVKKRDNLLKVKNITLITSTAVFLVLIALAAIQVSSY